MLMPNVLGNDSLKKALCNSIKNGRMPQALILEGDDGSGKMTFARELAAAALCEHKGADMPCGVCRSCDRIRRGVTPDVIIVRREENKTQIGVDAVRAMTEGARNGPCELPMLIYIIEDADTMNAQAQNAWLLMLENPPEDVAFILLCENAAKLLETVRSRAPIFRMQRFEPKEIVAYVRSHPKDFGRFTDDVLYECATASGGSIGKCVELCDPDNSAILHERRNFAYNAVRCAVLRTSAADRIRTVYGFPEKRDALADTFFMMCTILRDLVLLKADDRVSLTFFTESMRHEALELSDSCSMPQLLEFHRVLSEAANALAANASVKGTRTDTAIKLGLI